MDTFPEKDIKRLARGWYVRVAGEHGAVIYRRTVEETNERVRWTKQAEYVISCPHHPTVRSRYANTLGLAVSMAADTTQWCPGCREGLTEHPPAI